jgi:signal transduction histidine kinase
VTSAFPNLAGVATIAIVGWAMINLANGWVGFAAIVPLEFRGSGEAAISLARLFAAGVLVLMVVEDNGSRLRWLASGFAILGLGQLVFGYLEPAFLANSDLNESLYQMILVRTLAGALFVIALVPSTAPQFGRRELGWVSLVSLGVIAGYYTFSHVGALPELVRITSLEDAARTRIAPMSWMTEWHWLLAAIPLGLASVAAVAACRRQAVSGIGGWLPLSIILLAGSDLHDALWPSAYINSTLFTSADFLRLAMAAVVVIGGTLEIRRIAMERSTYLLQEIEHSRRLEHVAELKADFTAMVAHELGHPLSGIRRCAELISRKGIDPKVRDQALATILKELSTLDHMVADVQETSLIETDTFSVQAQLVPVGSIVEDAKAATEMYDREPALDIRLSGVRPQDIVIADRGRIGQVLRNLLRNAARHSGDGTPIRIQAVGVGETHVRFEVIDEGPGIHQEDLSTIFEKYGRGGRGNEASTGKGLGLYLSRRIVRAHGSELTVASEPGHGSRFAFDLRRGAGSKWSISAQ